jgi:UDP-N-acetylmuramate--alanine ligase
MHNVENAVVASAIALQAGVTEGELRAALISFKGVKRRFEYIINTPSCVYIDDYAHHPEELNAILGSVKRMYPDLALVIAFQPHLFTRTRDFMDEFAKALSAADEVFLLDIYPARELPLPGIDSALLLSKITCSKKALLSKTQLVESVTAMRPKLFLTLGAGDIDALVQPIKEGLQ